MNEVVVLIGAGSIGLAITRRVSAGRKVLIADLRQESVDAAALVLRDAGFAVETALVDITSRTAVEALAQQASAMGAVMALVHAAGVSPSQAPIATILAVDLYGTALVLEAFGAIMAPGGAGVVISSQSGYRMPALTIEEDRLLATTPAEELLALPMLASERITDTLHAYQMSKRANGLRVKAEAVRWAERGARVNAISPGIVITPLANDELNGPRGAGYRQMLERSPAGRAGTPDEIGALAAFVLGREGAFITGSDILIDGGVTASWYYGPLAPEKNA
ncbi:SDR family oxidoreductase [Novosphingobium sp.]|uniref:SDR family oxidoreductase n=1 Tax=Novosphingobium sp. TaxID=1874826 RepID=UPI0038BB4EFC